ncbi:MAG: ATP synthase F1 subunit gamma [Elusimicrobia bacterium RIFCSPLOWO2_01_FULL_54_10]|nr:MAG: ATP synthase F1 subunit gamma [Elusimicrobia bacterium RIFCSPLOWO2_01_FULL_54_10]
MASLREFRKKIKTVKSTQQITKAMKMVAAARLKSAQSRILQARPFAVKMRDMLTDLAGRVVTGDAADLNLFPHPLFARHATNKVGLLLVTADKGLCGSFNTNLIKKAGEFIATNKDKEIHFFIVGRKGRDFLKRLGFELRGEYVQIFGNLSYKHAEIIGEDIMAAFQKDELAEVTVIYNQFKSVLQQNLTAEKLLPVERPAKILSDAQTDFIYEPRREDLLAALLPRYVKSQIFRVLMESYAAELGARMSAMDSASKNAKELIEALTLRLNRSRQAIITREIAELVGGAEALS